MEEIESKKGEQGGKVEKPSRLRRRLIWPLKAKLLRTLPFKVGFLSILFFFFVSCEGVLDRVGCDPLLDGCRS